MIRIGPSRGEQAPPDPEPPRILFLSTLPSTLCILATSPEPLM